jgi:preprotein translocase subunit SecF
MMAGGGIAGRLYRGEVSINFVRRQKTWYLISGIILLVSVVALLVRGLNFSLEFKGGSSFTFPATATTTQNAISRVVTQNGGGDATIQFTSGTLHQWTVQTQTLTAAATEKIATALDHAFGIAQSKMSVQLVGPTWGSQITSKAVEALIIFLIVIVIYLSIAFEWRMAIAAFIALIHDIVITIGVYALTGFSVSPTSVIGLLTILGYSLYDTVVVFDKVRENTAGLLTTQKSNYSDAANLALNQTLVRSINTSLTALIPVATILFVGAGLLGAGTLKDLALVLFVGMLSGTYSSIFIATPVLADLKERQPEYRDLAVKVARRMAGSRSAQRAGETGSAVLGSTGAASAVQSTAVIETDEPEDLADTDEQPDETEARDDDDVAVSAAARAGETASTPRPVTRQQRVTGSTQRRPGTRKKRR